MSSEATGRARASIIVPVDIKGLHRTDADRRG